MNIHLKPLGTIPELQFIIHPEYQNSEKYRVSKLKLIMYYKEGSQLQK